MRAYRTEKIRYCIRQKRDSYLRENGAIDGSENGNKKNVELEESVKRGQTTVSWRVA